MDYLLHIIVIFQIYAVLALSLEVIAGQGGLLGLAQGALLGVGAYVAALIGIHVSPSFFAATISAALAALGAALAVGVATRRMRGDIFAVATFGLQVVASSVFVNWTAATRGPLGIPGIPSPTVFGVEIHERGGFAALYGILLVGALVVTGMLVKSPWGRVLRVVREDERLAAVLGKKAARAKVEAFAVSGILAGVAGAMFAFYFTYIEPSSFSVMESLLVLSMIVVGGAGNPWGAVLGAAVLVGLPELLRFIGLPSAVAANLRQIIYGVLLVVIVMARPRGLIGRYSFGRRSTGVGVEGKRA